ncbi:neural cell adhesion molecule 1-A [Teleopsis dalmanni]|uniref:neural cell adhesion molecule 1-A n=1 Tax=Teleopsis dalmanni TaxID=139649 RepID=UPI0018CE4F7B|nr:neural cell adhesion molecule 1-A [Teleopsis dalmanni]
MNLKVYRILRQMLVTFALISTASAKLHTLSLSGYGTGLLSTKDSHVKSKDIDAVEGKSVSLPCPLSSPLDDVYMVLWFRDNAGIPLYSFDLRDKLSSEGRHWSAPEVFGSRAKFNFDTDPATLEIKDIKRHDQGIYRCRIDFRTSQTQSFRFNLSVIVLPEQPIILDRWGRQLNGTKLGPKQEGDDIVITCRVVGGRPQPQVRWLVNGLLVDNQYEQNSGDVIENRLLWPSVQRTDLNSVFTCQALNTQLDKPREKSFWLDMHLKPLTVKIIDPPLSMVADRRYEVVCESNGSRPNAIITWYKGKRQLRRTKDEVSKNTTRSELSFVPITDDDNKSITCRAENPNVNGLYLETMWKLNVVYPPLVTLRLGSTLSPDDIKEGDDVYFECHVQSNPQWRKLLWLHNGMQLEHNTSARVIRSNQSLVLQKITKHFAGNYACSAINDEGETVSNQLLLRVKYTPICRHLDRVILIGASKDETVEVPCEVQADPPPRTFRWKFNNSGETLDIGSDRFSINGSGSMLKYTPMNDQDYGTLSCWAANEVGTQNQPCLFQVVLAALPNAVFNCTVYNRTDLSVDVQCIPGYDGGLPQIFVLEMFSARTGLTRFNLTNPEEPHFSLDNLDTLTSLVAQENNSLKTRIYAFNQKGRGPSYLLRDFRIGSTIYRPDEEVSLMVSPVLFGCVFTILVISLVITVRISLTTFFHKIRRSRQHDNKANVAAVVAHSGDAFKKNGNLEKPRWQHTDLKTKSSEDLVEDERDPDVIPSKYGNVTAGKEIAECAPTVAPNCLLIQSSTSKWSGNSNNITSNYDNILQQSSYSLNETSAPITFNQINARAHIITSSALILPTGPTASAIHYHTAGSNIPEASTTSSSSTVMIGSSAHLQQPLQPSVIEGTLPSTGLRTGRTNTLTSTINVGNGYASPNAFASNSNTNHMHINNSSLGHSSINYTNNNNITSSSNNNGVHHSSPILLPSQTSSTLSICGSSPSTEVGLLLTGSLNLSRNIIPAAPATLITTTSYNTSTDLDDNININAIKDCLMTQRVPESCV